MVPRLDETSLRSGVSTSVSLVLQLVEGIHAYQGIAVNVLPPLLLDRVGVINGQIVLAQELDSDTIARRDLSVQLTALAMSPKPQTHIFYSI